MVPEVGELQDVGHRGQGVPPRCDLGRRRPIPELIEEPVRQQIGQPSLHRIRDELLAGALVEVHDFVLDSALEPIGGV